MPSVKSDIRHIHLLVKAESSRVLSFFHRRRGMTTEQSHHNLPHCRDLCASVETVVGPPGIRGDLGSDRKLARHADAATIWKQFDLTAHRLLKQNSGPPSSHEFHCQSPGSMTARVHHAKLNSTTIVLYLVAHS